ncbi:hypothetical protein [Limibacillus sp. MBR-115]|uniref:hypothetical protein n=1 Tax=Limibacillus sp. MBR-115 TaxID=3156465 RepID=UPI003397FA10
MTDKPRDFKEFRKKNPHLEPFWPYLELLNKESDRGRVLISTGFLEQQLKDVLLAYMLEASQATDLVDGHNAPLGTFSSRITACYVLGLITEDEHHDLNLIRKIRNDFAHDIHTSFEKPDIADRCRELRHKAQDYDSEKLGEVRVGASGQFQTAAVSLIMHFINRPHYVSKHRCTLWEWRF